MRSGRHKPMATSPSRDWITSWRPVPCRTGSPAGDRSLTGRGRQLVTEPLQDGVASWRPDPWRMGSPAGDRSLARRGHHLATVFHKLCSPTGEHIL
ncbi:hypothetical protein YC2023_122397 [Brassica napus]